MSDQNTKMRHKLMIILIILPQKTYTNYFSDNHETIK